MRKFSVVGLALGLLFTLTPTSAPAGSLWDPATMLEVRDVKAGMKGYGKSVFHGTKIEQFGVTVLGVLEKAGYGSDIIIIRIDSGAPITEDFGVAQGMSGSPIYVTTPDGEKLIGALALAFSSFVKKPICGVTPIRQMIEALEPESSAFGPPLPVAQTGAVAARESFEIEGRRIDFAQVALPAQSALLFPQSTMTLTPVATPLMVSGLTGPALRRLQKFMEPFNVNVQAAPGLPVGAAAGGGTAAKAKLEPGAAVGVQLISGDIDISGIGTVTYVSGDRVLAFGHPMMMLGTAEVPMTTAYIHDVLPSSLISFKLGVAGEVVGRITQDRSFAIGGALGAAPETLRADFAIHDVGRGYSKRYHANVFRHKLLEPMLLEMALDSALEVVDSPLAETTKRVRFEIKPQGMEPIRRENLFTSGGLAGAGMMMLFGMGMGGPTAEVAETIDILANNKFRPVKIERVNVDVSIEEGRRSATIEAVTLARTRVKPGETVDLNLRIRPLNGAPFIEAISLTLPAQMPTGPAQVLIAGGRTAFMLRMSMGLRPGAPTTLEQTLDLLRQREHNNVLYVTMSPMMPGAVEMSGRKLSFLPQPLIEVLRATQPSSVRYARDEITRSSTYDFVLNGAQMVNLVVESEDREKVNPFFGGGAYGGGMPYGMGMPQDQGFGIMGLDDPFFDEGFDEYDFAAYMRRVTSARGDSSLDWLARWTEAWARSAGVDVLASWGLNLRARDEARNLRMRELRRLLATAPDFGTITRSGSGAPPHPFDEGDEDPDDTGDMGSGPAEEGTKKEGKPVGRSASVWAQSLERDFTAGKLDGAVVRSNGAIALAPEANWSSLGTTFAPLSQVSNGKGVRYVATWIEGQVMRLEVDGSASVVFRCADPAVTALALDKAENVYAAAAPSGVIYRIANGKGIEFCRLAEQYVWALAFDPRGNLFAATGPNGRLYRIDPTGRPTIAAQLPDRHALALALDASDNAYVGTSPRGRVYRVAPGGEVTTFFDAPRATVQCLTVDHDGNVYVGTSPRAVVYKVTKDGVATEVIKSRARHVMSLTTDRNGCVFAALGPKGKVYCLGKDGIVSTLLQSDDQYLTSLAELSAGRLVALTGSGARGLDLGPASRAHGTFTSTVKDCGTVARWGRIEWSGEATTGSAVTVQTRSGNTAFPDNNWSDWSDHYVNSEETVTSPPARYLQYRVNLFSQVAGAAPEASTFPRATPALKRVAIYFTTNNRAPQLALRAPQGGERWSKTKTVTWNEYDPDGDTLTHRAYFSNDGGKTWAEIKEEKKDESASIKKAANQEGPQIPEMSADMKKRLEDLKKQLKDDLKGQFSDLEKLLPPAPKTGKEVAAGPGGSPRQFMGGRSSYFPPGFDRSGDLTGGADFGEGFQRDPLNEQPPQTRKWDTSKLPDGLYFVKVVVDDKRANPKDGLSTEKLSKPIVIDNAPPLILTKLEIKEKPTQPMRVQIEDASSYIASVDYRIDEDGEWVAAAPIDRLLDSKSEEVEIDPEQITEGKHTLELRVRDAAGNETLHKVEYAWGKIVEKPKPEPKTKGATPPAKPGAPKPPPCKDGKGAGSKEKS